MTRKDYELIAAAVRDSRPTPIGPGESDVARRSVALANERIDDIVRNLCQRLAMDNSRFDVKRFVAACQGPSSS